MDSIKLEKLQAMKTYRRKNQLFPTLLQYSLSPLMLGLLFLSSSPWLPSACSSLKLFFMVTLRKMGAVAFGPKCLFIVCNIIIAFLVGESKLSRSSPPPDVYEELALRDQSLRGQSGCESKGEEGVIPERPLDEEGYQKDEEVEREEEKKGGGGGGGEEEEMRMGCEDLDGGEDEKGLPADELNKMVEDFIARVNLQRRLEARMLVCCV